MVEWWRNDDDGRGGIMVEWWRNDADLLANTRDGTALPVGLIEVLRRCSIVGDGIPLAGDASVRHKIHESRRILGDQAQTARRAGRGGQEYGVEAGRAHDVHVRAGLFHTGVGEQTSVNAGRR